MRARCWRCSARTAPARARWCRSCSAIQLADAGHIEVDGRTLPPGEPKAALAAGIGMVHQHFTLADNLSVLDNVMLGTEPLWRLRSRRAAGARDSCCRPAQRFGLQVEPDARVGELSVGERQRVEILKALVRGARVLILDEPTAVLTPQESASLFATLQQLVAGGMAIDLHQPQARRGAGGGRPHRRCCAPDAWSPSCAPPAPTRRSLAEAMVGRAVATVRARQPRRPAPRAPWSAHCATRVCARPVGCCSSR